MSLFFVGMFLFLGNLYANGYVGVMKGTIKGADVIYKDSDEITVRAGYGECNKNYWEINSAIDVDLYSALPTGEDFVYIYIDDSASTYPTPTIIGATTEPAWSDSKMGWYKGDDRCIGVIWSPSSGREIQNYVLSSDDYIMASANIHTLLSNGNPNGSYQTCEATNYSPVNALGVYAVAKNSDNDSNVSVQVSSFESTFTRDVYSSGYGGKTVISGFIPFERGDSRDLKWWGYDDDDNSFEIYLTGYRIER